MRIRLIVPLLAVLALSAACSVVRISYDNADWILARMAARYVDMDRDQTRALKTQLGQLQAWHRREELPRYAALLDEGAARVQRGLTREDLAWAVASVRGRYQVLAHHAVTDLAPVLVTLNDSQIAGMEARFAADNRKFYAAKLSKSSEDSVETQAAWITARLEDWTGGTSPAQRELIVNLVRAYPNLPALRLTEREHRQAQFLGLLRAHPNDRAMQTQLVALVADPSTGPNGPYRDTLSAWEVSFVDTMVALDHSLTARQRATTVERLRRYAQEFRSLAQEGENRESTAIPAPSAG